MDAGLVKGEGFAVDASVIEADASRYHGKAPGEIDWSAPERQRRAVAEFLTALDDEGADADRKPPKVISPVDPCSAWTAKANKRVQFGYGLNYLIDIEYAVIIVSTMKRSRARNFIGNLLAEQYWIPKFQTLDSFYQPTSAERLPSCHS
jgi:hypothetical protein